MGSSSNQTLASALPSPGFSIKDSSSSLATSDANMPAPSSRSHPDQHSLQLKKSRELFQLGVQRKDSGDLTGSALAFQQALRLTPGDVTCWMNFGYLLNELARYQEAAVALTTALKIKPDDEQVYGNLGVTFLRMGKLQDAAGCFEKAISLNPDFVSAYSNLGLVLATVGQYGEAKVYYRKALDLAPGNPVLQQRLEAVGEMMGAKESAPEPPQESSPGFEIRKVTVSL